MRISLAVPAALLALSACGGGGGTAPEPPAGPAAAVQVALPLNLLVEGRAMQLAAYAVDAAGRSAPAAGVRWETSDPAVAEVSPEGVLRAVGKGEVAVTAVLGGLRSTGRLTVMPALIPLFRAPFDGRFPVYNAFDHGTPPSFPTLPGRIVDWRGLDLAGHVGHGGWDWLMPEGTPVLAAAGGVVISAGKEGPGGCGFVGQQPDPGLRVEILHRAPDGERFISGYAHLSRVDVAVDQVVAAGEQVGLAGDTGCAKGGPSHLHFSVVRELYARSGKRTGSLVDPAGWAGSGEDPWLVDEDGAPSSRLWIPGAEPPLTTGP